MITFSPFSVSSFAAQPPLIPDPITIASYVFSAITYTCFEFLDIADHHPLLQRLQLVLPRRDELLRHIIFKPRSHDRPHNGGIEQLLGLVDLMPARDPA